MSGTTDDAFVHPTWSALVYRDDAGKVIEYGNRWRGEVPDSAYGVTSNLGRFSPLHLVAAALVEYVLRTYQVVASEARDQAGTLIPQPPEFIRLLRLDPEGPTGESMTIVFTSLPGVVVYAGADFPEAFPACGCDACDDAVDDVADALEARVLALARHKLGWSLRS